MPGDALAQKPSVSEPPRGRAECSGLTTRGILVYVERVGGRPAVDAVLDHAGLPRLESELRDEDAWFPDEYRVRLFAAARDVLGDPQVARRIGEAALELGVGQALKVALRALGSPRLIYGAIPRINDKFNVVHPMEVTELGSDRAVVTRTPLPGVAHHSCDCEYNSGLFACVPQLFGEPAARVRHDVCLGEGAEKCVYEVRWSSMRDGLRPTAAVGAGAGLAVVGSALFAPAAMPFALAGAGAGLTASAVLAAVRGRRRLRMLEEEVRSEADAAERLRLSLQDLASALGHDEVLEKVTAEAQAAVGGAEFALLLRGRDGRLRSQSSSGLPSETLLSLEAWASLRPGLLERAAVIDAVDALPALAELVDHSGAPLCSLCVAPVRYRDESIGVLIAVAGGRQAFLPRDAEQLQAYATQAAIAVNNARLYSAQKALASRDPLTGLLNHREFHEAVERELERCRREGGTVGVALFDLDDFKAVNDREGHAEGDRALKRVADVLAGASRAPDLTFRIGGDEFALMLPGVSAESGAEASGRIAGVVRREAGLGTSCGVAAWPDDGLTKDAVLAAADRRLYAAKHEAHAPAPSATGRSRASARRERLASIGRLATRLAPLTDEREIAEVTVRELDHGFSYLHCVVSRLGEDGRLAPLAWSGRLAEELGDFGRWRQRADEGVSGRAITRGEPVVVSDTDADPDFIEASEHSNARSELAVPIRVGGAIWGVLNIEQSMIGAFDADDLPFAAGVAGTVGAAIGRGRLVHQIEDTFVTTLGVLCDALEAKDPYTAAHAHQVADLTEAVGRRLEVSGDQLRLLRYGGLLHDVGKIAIRTEILLKPGPLSAAEFEEMKEHTVVGAEMLARIPGLAGVSRLVRSAHEAWDGSGYPEGQAGEDIPLGARIIAACDAYHAMTSDRPYRRAMAESAAREELRVCAGSQFDPRVIAALLDELAARGAGEIAAGAETVEPAAARVAAPREEVR